MAHLDISQIVRGSGVSFQRQMNHLLQTRFELTSPGAVPYNGEICKSYVSSHLRLADIRFSPHYTRLKAGRPSGRGGHNYLVSHQVEGTALVRQGGREAEIRPNQIFFINTSEPFEIATEEIRTRSIYLDSYFWQEIFPERDVYTATAMDCGHGLGQTCARMIDEIFDMSREQSERMMNRLAGCLANLLAVSMVTSLPRQPDSRPLQERSLARIREVVLRNLADADLDCPRIAAEVGLSPRQVHTIVGRSGTTLMRWIWEQRLQRIVMELENATLSGKPVSTIAFEWGYNEAAHFSRQFKARFGMSPQKYRRTRLAGLAQKCLTS